MILLVGWFLARGARAEAMEIRRSQHPNWIEVYRNGKLEETCKAEQSLAGWAILDGVLKHNPDLYREPPAGTSSGSVPEVR